MWQNTLHRTLIVVGLLMLIAPAVRAASLPPTESSTGLVVSSQHLAAEVGVAMLRQGGNAIDAAVAVGYAEAVVNPCCGNISGGGFMTAHLKDGRNVFLDFRGTAPAAASRNMYLDGQGQPVRGASLYGWKAVGVPGTVMGLETALTQYGSLARATLMAPAIRLARDGFVLEDEDAAILAHHAELLRKDQRAAAIFLHPDGSPLRAGERLAQPDLARTLQMISDQGASAFYTGAIPAAIEATSRAGGGVMTAADLAAYRMPEAEPMHCSYRGYLIMAPPPPSSGGTTLCEILNILEPFNLSNLGFHAAQEVHLLTEAERYAFFDRNTYLGDPAFVQNPLQRLLSKDYAARMRGQITDKATASASLGPAVPAPGEKAETTSYSVLDKAGNAVAVTYTLNGGFGAGVIAGDTGFLLNDEMDDFSTAPGSPNNYGLVQGEANAIAPGKRPLSSMTPLVILRDGQVRMVVGSPGGPRIITTVLQAFLNVVDYGMNAQEAVDAPRLHHQWQPDVVQMESFALSPDTEALLRDMGYQLKREPAWGAVALIAASSHPGVYQGAADPRRPTGAALAP